MGGLRDLSVSQQVGLLFVVLFGLLGARDGRRLREHDPRQLARAHHGA